MVVSTLSSCTPDLEISLLKHAGGEDEAKFLRCAMNGDDEGVIAMLDRNVDPYTACQGKTALHLAADKGHHLVIAALLDRHPEMVNMPTASTQTTALHLVGSDNADKTVNTLLFYGAQFDLKDHIGWTPLHWMAAFGRNVALRTLLNFREYYFKTFREHLAQMIDLIPLDLLRIIYAYTCESVDEPNEEGRTPLVDAVRSNRLEVSLRPHSQASKWAITRQIEVISLLLNARADAAAKVEGANLLEYAVSKKVSAQIIILLKKAVSGDGSKKCEEEREAKQEEDRPKDPDLHHAVRIGNYSGFLESLARYPEQVNMRSRIIGVTPLHLVRGKTQDSDQFVRDLLLYGAKINVKDSDGWTPLHWMAAFGNERAALTLLKCERLWYKNRILSHLSEMPDKCADLIAGYSVTLLQEVNKSGKTPLGEVLSDGSRAFWFSDNPIRQKRLRMVKLLLSEGANPDQELVRLTSAFTSWTPFALKVLAFFEEQR